ncbi:hypothetical protein J6590_071761, partial [Homalodisca vitripennis]
FAYGAADSVTLSNDLHNWPALIVLILVNLTLTGLPMEQLTVLPLVVISATGLLKLFCKWWTLLKNIMLLHSNRLPSTILIIL